MLTAAVRDLHACYPDLYVTDVRTPCPDLWLHNPHLTPLDENDPDVRVIDCHYPLIDRSNTAPYHFIHGFIEYLNDVLELQIKPTLFTRLTWRPKGEWVRRSRTSGPAAAVRRSPPAATRLTIKWWSPARYRSRRPLRGRLDFVQVGEDEHPQPALDRGSTARQPTLRQLLRSCTTRRFRQRGEPAHAPGGAVEMKPGMPQNSPCVWCRRSRATHFTSTPSTVPAKSRALLCCDQGGCGSRARSRGRRDRTRSCAWIVGSCALHALITAQT